MGRGKGRTLVARASPSVQNYRTRALFPNGRDKNKPRETGSCVSHLNAGLPDRVEAVADCPSPRWRRRWVRDGGCCSCSCSWARCCSHAALSGAASASSCCTPRGPRRAGERAPAVGGDTARPRSGDAERWGKVGSLGWEERGSQTWGLRSRARWTWSIVRGSWP